jgi:hypothetical protein
VKRAFEDTLIKKPNARASADSDTRTQETPRRTLQTTRGQRTSAVGVRRSSQRQRRRAALVPRPRSFLEGCLGQVIALIIAK